MALRLPWAASVEALSLSGRATETLLPLVIRMGRKIMDVDWLMIVMVTLVAVSFYW